MPYFWDSVQAGPSWDWSSSSHGWNWKSWWIFALGLHEFQWCYCIHTCSELAAQTICIHMPLVWTSGAPGKHPICWAGAKQLNSKQAMALIVSRSTVLFVSSLWMCNLWSCLKASDLLCWCVVTTARASSRIYLLQHSSHGCEIWRGASALGAVVLDLQLKLLYTQEVSQI